MVNGKLICSAPTPAPSLDTIVYRVIDLSNPFVGQKGEARNTGSNWCAYASSKQSFNCESYNATVQTVIPKNKNVYDDKALYKVTLDSETISKIRDYNKKHKYDDWNLTCYDNGNACVSKFIHNTVIKEEI